MSKELSQIEFYFLEGDFNDASELAQVTVARMQETGSIEYCGYFDEADLKDGLMHNFGSGLVQSVSLTDEQKSTIEQTVIATIETCDEKLPVPTKNFVFVHPYFPGEKDAVFEGVMAVASYSCVFHLFIHPATFTPEALENTVAHELNHTIYMYHHHDDMSKYTLLDNTLMEGLAENFREDFFKPERSAWAGALTEDEELEVLNETDAGLLASTDKAVIREFMFGNDTYKNWNGYSLGYWLVKRFIAQNPQLSWEELMKIPKEQFHTTLQ